MCKLQNTYFYEFNKFSTTAADGWKCDCIVDPLATMVSSAIW